MRSARRFPALLLVVLALVGGACTDDGELGGPGFGDTTAAVVGDDEISTADLQDEVELWATNPQFLQIIGVQDLGREGVRSADLVAFVLSHRIISEQARLLSAADGYEPSQQQIDLILQQIDQQFTAPGTTGSLFQAYPEEFRQRLATDLAYQNHLPEILGTDIVMPEVEVNPRFGQADVLEDGLIQVLPPTGPLPAPLELDAPLGT